MAQINIQFFLNIRGWTLDRMAEHFEVSRQTLTNWQLGRHPAPMTAIVALRTFADETIYCGCC